METIRDSTSDEAQAPNAPSTAMTDEMTARFTTR
jgi:hypothetical protein